LVHQLDQRGRLFSCDQFPFLAGDCQRLAMLGVGVRVRFVPVGLAGLREEDERSGVSCL
jgi:hypothetical protein